LNEVVLPSKKKTILVQQLDCTSISKINQIPKTKQIDEQILRQIKIQDPNPISDFRRQDDEEHVSASKVRKQPIPKTVQKKPEEEKKRK